MRIWMYELRLLLRARIALFALLLLGALSIAAVAAGLAEVDRQRAAIAAVAQPQGEDIAAIAAWVDKSKDAGNAAYYSFHRHGMRRHRLPSRQSACATSRPISCGSGRWGWRRTFMTATSSIPSWRCPAGLISPSCWFS